MLSEKNPWSLYSLRVLRHLVLLSGPLLSRVGLVHSHPEVILLNLGPRFAAESEHLPSLLLYRLSEQHYLPYIIKNIGCECGGYDVKACLTPGDKVVFLH